MALALTKPRIRIFGSALLLCFLLHEAMLLSVCCPPSWGRGHLARSEAGGTPALPDHRVAAEESHSAVVENEYKAIEDLVKAYYPKAKFQRTADGLHFQHRVKREYGYYSNDLILSPQEGGILGDVSLRPGVCNEMQMTVADGFHSTLTMAPYSKNLNAHLLVKLTFPSSDFSFEFQDQFTDLVQRFGEMDDAIVPPSTTAAPQPDNATKQPARSPLSHF